MNKFGMVLGVAAVVSLAGCKDPDYKRGNVPPSQTEVKAATSTTVSEPIVIENVPPPASAKPAPMKPIAVVPVQPIPPEHVAKPVAAKPESTTYIVQRGDSLSKISKKFNIRIDALRKANPKIKKDIVRVGQKLTLPGKVDVGVQTVPAGAFAKSPKAAKRAPYAPYTGATKEYVIKSGDTLGSIAYANGITIRQLKELNGLSKDALRIGQKLKIPSEKVVKQAKAKKPAEAAPQAAKKETKPAEAAAPAETKPAEATPAPAEATAAPAETKPAEQAAPAETKPAEQAAAAAPTMNYVVQDGEDITGIAIRFGLTAARIREMNNMADDAQLVTGQILKLPAEQQ